MVYIFICRTSHILYVNTMHFYIGDLSNFGFDHPNIDPVWVILRH